MWGGGKRTLEMQLTSLFTSKDFEVFCREKVEDEAILSDPGQVLAYSFPLPTRKVLGRSYVADSLSLRHYHVWRGRPTEGSS